MLPWPRRWGEAGHRWTVATPHGTAAGACVTLERAQRLSESVLREFGNLSSAFVYFVLEAALADRARGGWWWMSSFGAGFSCHGALLEVA